MVHPHRDEHHLVVDVIDDGVGLPEGFQLGNQKSLGLAIISTLVGDLGGSLEIGPADSGTGTRARLVLPTEV